MWNQKPIQLCVECVQRVKAQKMMGWNMGSMLKYVKIHFLWGRKHVKKNNDVKLQITRATRRGLTPDQVILVEDDPQVGGVKHSKNVPQRLICFFKVKLRLPKKCVKHSPPKTKPCGFEQLLGRTFTQEVRKAKAVCRRNSVVAAEDHGCDTYLFVLNNVE